MAWSPMAFFLKLGSPQAFFFNVGGWQKTPYKILDECAGWAWGMDVQHCVRHGCEGWVWGMMWGMDVGMNVRDGCEGYRIFSNTSPPPIKAPPCFWTRMTRLLFTFLSITWLRMVRGRCEECWSECWSKCWSKCYISHCAMLYYL